MSKQAFKRLREKLQMQVNREPLPEYAWPGGYDLIYVCRDGGEICGACVNANITLIDEAIRAGEGVDDQWYVLLCFSSDQIESAIHCDSCNKLLGPEVEQDEVPENELVNELVGGFLNPLRYRCAPNECSPGVAAEKDFRNFLAYGLMRSWIPGMIGDDRNLFPMPVAHEYITQSQGLREAFLGCVYEAITAYDRGEVEIGRHGATGWDHAVPEASLRLEDGTRLHLAWVFSVCTGEALCFDLDSSQSDHSNDSEYAWVEIDAFRGRIPECLCLIAKAADIIRGEI